MLTMDRPIHKQVNQGSRSTKAGRQIRRLVVKDGRSVCGNAFVNALCAFANAFFNNKEGREKKKRKGIKRKLNINKCYHMDGHTSRIRLSFSIINNTFCKCGLWYGGYIFRFGMF